MSSALPIPPYYSEAEFLALEESSPVKHEFLNGIVYDMAGGTDRHAVVAGNILALLWNQLRGKGCRPYGSDLLTKIEHGSDVRMYYPDIAVYCDQKPTGVRAKENPVVVVEVLSPSTEKYDRSEKRLAYLRIDSLQALLLVGSEQRSVTVWRRAESGWVSEEIIDPNAAIPLPAIEAELRIAEIYEGLEEL